MKINVIENGIAVTRDMTPEEEQEFIVTMSQNPNIPSAEDRIQALESAMLDIILGG